jgi:hypothetical protein
MPSNPKPFEPLTALRPDIGIQIRDVRPGMPPCLGPVDLATFRDNLATALMSEFPGAYIDSACVGANPADQATAFGVWLTPPASEEERQTFHRGLTELGGRKPNQTISFFLNARLFRRLTAKAWSDPGMYKRLDDNGIPQLDGSVHLKDLDISMRPPDTLVTTITGYDDRPVPDADFTITLAETYKVDQFDGRLGHTSEQTLDIDTWFHDAVAAALALTVFAWSWMALPFMLAAYQTVKLHQAEDEGVAARKGAGSTVTDHFLLPAIPIPDKKKLPISYVGNVEVTEYGLFAGGLLLPEVPRTPSLALVGPSSIRANVGQGMVNGHYHVEVDDLLGPVTYTWTSDGEVIGQGAKVVVRFSTPPSGQSQLSHVGVTATDSDGMVVAETRRVSVATASQQGLGGHGHGGQGGGGSNNPPQEP